MVLASNIAPSMKKKGKYEEAIIQRLIPYFTSKGYEVIPHSRLNVAWGPIISDVDLLLIKNGLITYVEVKSSKDKIARASEQINQTRDFVDYAYVATEKNVINWSISDVGLILVKAETIKMVKRARRFTKKPMFLSVLCLKKKCLAKLTGVDDSYIKRVDKYDLAQNAYTIKGSKCTRKYLREIVTCGEACTIFCPIVKMSK